MPNKIISGESKKLVEINNNVTKRFGAIPIEYGDINSTKIEIKKINEVIKPIPKDQLTRAEKNRINSFRVNIYLDFTESVVK